MYKEVLLTSSKFVVLVAVEVTLVVAVGIIKYKSFRDFKRAVKDNQHHN